MGALASTPVEMRQVFDLSVRIAGDTPSFGSMRKFHGTEVTKISPAGLTFLLCFGIATVFVIAANLRLDSMAKEVIPRLPSNHRLRDRRNLYEIQKLHATMYPDSPKRWQMWTLAITGFLFAFGGFVAASVLPH